MLLTALTAAAIAVCPPSGARRHCVHDGDTLWWNGEKIRVADIDAPELRDRCLRERQLAIAARERIIVLLNAEPVSIRRTGRDRYGRTLARMGGVGEQLIREGLVSRWPTRRDWCAGA